MPPTDKSQLHHYPADWIYHGIQETNVAIPESDSSTRFKNQASSWGKAPGNYEQAVRASPMQQVISQANEPVPRNDYHDRGNTLDFEQSARIRTSNATIAHYQHRYMTDATRNIGLSKGEHLETIQEVTNQVSEVSTRAVANHNKQLQGHSTNSPAIVRHGANHVHGGTTRSSHNSVPHDDAIITIGPVKQSYSTNRQLDGGGTNARAETETGTQLEQLWFQPGGVLHDLPRADVDVIRDLVLPPKAGSADWNSSSIGMVKVVTIFTERAEEVDSSGRAEPKPRGDWFLVPRDRIRSWDHLKITLKEYGIRGRIILLIPSHTKPFRASSKNWEQLIETQNELIVVQKDALILDIPWAGEGDGVDDLQKPSCERSVAEQDPSTGIWIECAPAEVRSTPERWARDSPADEFIPRMAIWGPNFSLH